MQSVITSDGDIGLVQANVLLPATILGENRALVESLRDLLIEKRMIEAKTLKAMTEDKHG